jgi:hypothetical protein
MPRKSAAELSVIPAPTGRYSRLSPPRPRDDAPADVAEVFRELVRSAPADHFRGGDGALLEQYAQSIILARKAYDELSTNGPVIDNKPSPWLVVLEKAHRSAVALSGRLRLAPQSRADARSAGRNANRPPLSAYEFGDHE